MYLTNQNREKMNKNIEKKSVTLRKTELYELDKFKSDLQESFRVSIEKEFGHDFEEPIPSNQDIEESIMDSNSIVYSIIFENELVGGAIVHINKITQYNSLSFFFIMTNKHSRGIGYLAWKAIEKEHPKTKIWETITPYFEKRNIHFYVNKCGFKIVEFYNKYRPEPNHSSQEPLEEYEMFRFEKIMK